MRIFKFIFIVSFYASLTAGVVACNKKNEHQTAQGGQDSGGGNTTSSTLEEVEFYHLRVAPLLPSILAHFFSEVTIANFKSEEKKQLLAEVINKINFDKPLNTDEDMLKQFIEKFPILIQKNASCRSLDKIHAHASILKFEIGSAICLSYSELTKTPKSSLEREIISLLLHEYMHGLGYNEKDASTIQNALLVNFDRIFPSGIKTYIKNSDRSLNGIFSREDFYGMEIEIYEKILKTNTISLDHTKILCNPMAMEIYYERIIDEDIQLWARFGPQLVDLGHISDVEIDKHLELIDLNYDQLNKKIDTFSYDCSEKSKKLPAKSRSKLILMISDLKKFYSLIEETNNYIRQYN